MHNQAPVAVDPAQLPNHPARRAWLDFAGGPEPVTVDVWRGHMRKKPAIFRLAFADERHSAVFAKRYPGTGWTVERTIYEEILPQLPLTFPRCYGFHAEDPGSHWLFVEDVGNRRFDPRDPQHRVLAGTALGKLHRFAADVPAVAELPDAGPRRYLEHLRSARCRILNSSGNPGLRPEDHALLGRIRDLLDDLESRWHELERACRGATPTLVHGDFQPQNTRILGTDASLALSWIDWEMAGFGIPAIDLAPARNPGLAMQIDAGAYETEVRARWPELDAQAIRRLSIVGQIFNLQASIDWACTELKFEAPRFLEWPVSTLSGYMAQLIEALRAAEAWLD